ncbi:sensor histidine kinase [Cellulomonas soli]|uniref:histidine kinase n=1 Tax=Cellulomonas soli TaxID=931535 RepID=A0A512PHF7_9CELL|nr:HAMP domain-containing sensor histidine kinase [Cellulomonas soli]NYI60768.1 signal transduction histidine kinase [Cellulomonas soli]GEP70648.1 putative sensor histidine kinase [Cellulomonas soli]
MRADLSRWWSRRGLAARLLVALGVVTLTGTLTAWLVAAATGPSLFHEHMVRAGLDAHDEAVLHAEEAFTSASALSLAVALLTAVVASLAVSVVLTRRIGGSVGSLAAAARRVGAGQYDAPVTSAGLGTEFEELAASFSGMAARLAEAERLRARLLADVAHEVRTPVATIDAYLEAVEDGVQPLDEATVHLLREQGRRLTRLADDLAAVTRAESGDLHLDRRRTPAADLVHAAVRAGAERAATAHVQLTAAVEPDAPSVEVDGHRLAQVLDNLVTNALRHTPTGGHVTVSARAGSSGRLELQVRDDGEGISPEHLPHVFERFYRADTARDRARGGSGIGLAISKALVEAHGGTITADSAGPGQGAVFTVELPTA